MARLFGETFMTHSSQSTGVPGVQRIESLDGLRGIAAIVVVIYHSVLVVPEISGALVDGVEPTFGTAEWVALRTPVRLLIMGPESVMIFFILSGFVLTLGLVGRKMTRPFVSSYLARRVVRLYVPVLAAVLFALALAVAVPRDTGAASSWIASHKDPSPLVVVRDAILLLGTSNLNSPLWSLKWEVWFSLLLPLIWVIFRTVRVERWWVLAIPILLFMSFIADFPVVREALPLAFITGGLLKYLPVFCLGMILALKVGTFRTWYQSASVTVRSVLWAGVATLFLVPPLVEPFAPLSPLVRGEFWVLSLLGSLGVVMLVTVSLSADRFLASRPVMFFGRRSFSLYLVHEPIIVAAALLVGATGWLPWAAMLPIVWGVTLLVTVVFYRWVEYPSIGLSRRAGRIFAPKESRVEA